MIGYLRGKILEHADGKMTIGVGGDVACVGYVVSVPQSPEYLRFVSGGSAELFVHTHVREDALDLYGFATAAEKALFLTLLGVNGIGPKMALNTLSKVDSQTLIDSILGKDADALVQIPGIGKKTAERIVLELADPLRKKLESGLLVKPTPGHAARADGAGATVVPRSSASSAVREAKEALLGLGYREQEVLGLLNRVMEEAGTPRRTEDLVRTALQRLAQPGE